eukprot:scaffold26793_cov30-Tisochrysis_lutea.AAC.1
MKRARSFYEAHASLMGVTRFGHRGGTFPPPSPPPSRRVARETQERADGRGRGGGWGGTGHADSAAPAEPNPWWGRELSVAAATRGFADRTHAATLFPPVALCCSQLA